MDNLRSLMYTNYRNTADQAYMSGDYATAAEYYQLAVETDPTNADALLYLGMSYYNQGNTTEADRVFNEFQQLFPARASEVEGYIVNHDTTSGTQETNADGTAVQETNADGTPVQERNADGTLVQETNADGTPVQETNADGTVVQETNADGTPVQETSADGTPIITG